jgi:hypothetical protein
MKLFDQYRELRGQSEFLQKVTGAPLHDVDALHRALLKIEGVLHRADEDECNGVYTNGKAQKALDKARKACSAYPRLGVYHQSDPRGVALFVYDKNEVRGGIGEQYARRGRAVYLP